MSNHSSLAAPGGLRSAPRSLRFGERALPVAGPSWRDPRLHVAATVIALQVLGQVGLDFEVSIAQILLCLGACAAVELTITLVRDRAIVWPGSALLTGNGIALVFRANGTMHGDWWSTRGGTMFATCAVVSMLSKYALRVDGRHLFNPSNLGLVVCFLAFGTGRANPLDLYWGPWSPSLALAYGAILLGGLTVARRVRMLNVVAAFATVFAAATGVVAGSGHAMSARWHVGPVTDWTWWRIVVLSPEILVFALLMITDPRTAPRGRTARVAYGATVALASALLAAPQRTEFATKVAILGGLVIGCALRPLFEHLESRMGAQGELRESQRADRVATAVTGRGALIGMGALVGVVGLAMIALSAALVLASFPARNPLPSAQVIVDADTIRTRPSIVLDPATIPAVTIDASASALEGGLDQARGEKIVNDVLVDLEIEHRASVRNDPALAATGIAGRRLQQFTINAGARPDGPPPRVRAALVMAVRDASNVQAVPRLAVEITGIDTEGRAVHDTLVVVEAEGRYLIEDRRPS